MQMFRLRIKVGMCSYSSPARLIKTMLQICRTWPLPNLVAQHWVSPLQEFSFLASLSESPGQCLNLLCSSLKSSHFAGWSLANVAKHNVIVWEVFRWAQSVWEVWEELAVFPIDITTGFTQGTRRSMEVVSTMKALPKWGSCRLSDSIVRLWRDYL